MDNASSWLAGRQDELFKFSFLLMTVPIERLLLPFLTARIIHNLDNRLMLVRSVSFWILTFILISFGYYFLNRKKHKILASMNDSAMRKLFNDSLDAEWSVTNNNLYELLSIMQSSRQQSRLVLELFSSVIGSQVITILGTFVIFAWNATWYVTLLLVILVCVGFRDIGSNVFSCQQGVRDLNEARFQALSSLTDLISSSTMLSGSTPREKEDLITPALKRLEQQDNQEYRCRESVGMRIGVATGLITLLVYSLMFSDFLNGYVNKEQFTMLFVVATQVFEMPQNIENSLFDLVSVRAYDEELRQRLTPARHFIRTTSQHIQVKNVRLLALAESPPISLTVREGTIVSLTGPNGCGKSSLLRVLAGVEAPQNDDAFVALPGALQYVPQNASLVNKTIPEIIGIGQGRVPSVLDANRLLTNNHLGAYVPVLRKYMHEPVGEGGKKLSGGQRQIVWMLRMLYSRTNCVLLDEPTAWMSGAVSTAYLKCLRKNHMTAVIVTHDIQVQQFADQELQWEDLLS